MAGITSFSWDLSDKQKHKMNIFKSEQQEYLREREENRKFGTLIDIATLIGFSLIFAAIVVEVITHIK